MDGWTGREENGRESKEEGKEKKRKTKKERREKRKRKRRVISGQLTHTLNPDLRPPVIGCLVTQTLGANAIVEQSDSTVRIVVHTTTSTS